MELILLVSILNHLYNRNPMALIAACSFMVLLESYVANSVIIGST